MSDLPPEWYSRFERFLSNNKGLLFLILYILVFFVWPFFADSDPLDVELLVGLPLE